MAILETARLTIRPPRVTDVNDYTEFRNSEFVLRYNAMAVERREEAEVRFSRENTPWNTFVMEHRETGKVIGVVFTEEDSLRWGVNSREVSYFMNEDFARQGYMKEALGVVVEHLFETERRECVAARSFVPNEASRNLLLSLGFHQDGLIPRCVRGYGGEIFDDAIYSLLQEEFPGAR